LALEAVVLAAGAEAVFQGGQTIALPFTSHKLLGVSLQDLIYLFRSHIPFCRLHLNILAWAGVFGGVFTLHITVFLSGGSGQIFSGSGRARALYFGLGLFGLKLFTK
jgi:hypothetical protein